MSSMKVWLVTLDGEQKIILFAQSKSAARKRGLEKATEFVSVRLATPEEIKVALHGGQTP